MSRHKTNEDETQRYLKSGDYKSSTNKKKKRELTKERKKGLLKKAYRTQKEKKKRELTNRQSKFVNKVNNNHNFMLTSEQKKQILIFTTLKEFVKKEIRIFSRVSLSTVAKKTRNISKEDYKKAVGVPDEFRKTRLRIEKELSAVLKNQLFDPFNTTTVMSAFTRWKSINSYKPENRIYRFNPAVLKKLVLSIKEMNTKIIKLVNLRVELIYTDYDKIRHNKHIEYMSSRIKSTLTNLNKIIKNIKNINVSESQLKSFVKNMSELEKYSTDIGRRNERL